MYIGLCPDKVLSLYHLPEKSWTLHHHPASAFVRGEMTAAAEVMTAVPEVMGEVTAVAKVMNAVPEMVFEEWRASSLRPYIMCQQLKLCMRRPGYEHTFLNDFCTSFHVLKNGY